MKFSVIIPIFNVENTLKQCIDSIIKQTYKEIEIILINDGSTDNSGKICDEYKMIDNRIKVIHKENGGLSDARNMGIKNSTGDYLVFVDSDDYINNINFIEEIYKILKNKEFDMIVYGYKKFWDNNNKIIEKASFKKDINKSTIQSLIEQNYLKASACDKIVSKDFITQNEIYFPYGRYSEDIEWCAKILKKIDFEKIDVYNKNVYMYRQRNTSISKNVTEKNINDIISMIIEQRYKDDIDNERKMIVNSYLAYEYSVVLGLINSTKVKQVDKKTKDKVYEQKSLLNYNYSKKVQKIQKLSKVLNIKILSKILGIYIDIK